MSTNGPELSGGDGETIDLDASQAAWKAEQARRKKTAVTKKGPNSKGDTKVSTKYLDKYKEMNPNAVEGKDYYIEDEPTSDKNLAKKVGSTLEEAVEKKKGFVGSESKTKKPGGTLSYKDSYTDAVASKWESKGGYDAYEKAAKAWNKKKYGTTEPTSKAKAGGITKKELATKHADKPKFTESLTINGKKTDVKDLGPKYTSYGVMAPKPRPTDNAANTSLGKTIGAANSSESLLGGVQTRREKRKIARHELSQKLDPRQNERKRSREQRRNARKTGSKFGKPSSTPELNTGAGTYQGGPVKKKKTGGGEFWGKSGPIK